MSIADDLARIAMQEERLQFTGFDEETAWKLGSELRALAEERELSVVIDVRRMTQPLFYSAMAGTTADNVNWVRRKSNLAIRFMRSSYAIGLELQEKNATLLERYALPDSEYASHGGCFPIRVVGVGMIGAVTVSGLPQRADHELAAEGLCSVIGCNYAELRLD